jgi:hypothetical protein
MVGCAGTKKIHQAITHLKPILITALFGRIADRTFLFVKAGLSLRIKRKNRRKNNANGKTGSVRADVLGRTFSTMITLYLPGYDTLVVTSDSL